MLLRPSKIVLPPKDKVQRTMEQLEGARYQPTEVGAYKGSI